MIVLLLALAIICVVFVMQVAPRSGAGPNGEKGERSNIIKDSLGKANDLKDRADKRLDDEDDLYEDPTNK